ncbi:MAG: hypothetical protein CL790_04780 [Chloroflexi bacterium]|nr:hypothetical protein [Chloroflexota bacterium]
MILAARPHRRSILLAFAVYAVATVTVFPLSVLIEPQKIFYGNVDSLLILATLEWERVALLTDPTRLFDGLVYFPFKGTMFFTHLMLGALPVYMPVATFFGSSVGFAALVLLTPVLNAMAMFGAGWFLLGRWWPAFIAGFVFAFNPLQMHYTQFAHLAVFWWTPLAIASWFWFIKKPVWWKFSLAWFLVFIQFATGVYLGFIALTCLLSLIVAAVFAGQVPWRDGRLVAKSLVGAGVAAALFVPLLSGYLGFWLDHREVRSLAEASGLSARIQDYMSIANQELRWYEALGRDRGISSLGVPGISAVVMAVLGIFFGVLTPGLRSVITSLGLFGCVLFVWSLGPDLWWNYERTGVVLPYAWAHAHLPGFAVIRNPAFLSLGVMVAVAFLAAMGIDQVQRRVVRWRWLVTVIGLLGMSLLVGEFARTPTIIGSIPERLNLTRAMQVVPKSPSVFVPVGSEFNSSEPNVQRLWWSVRGSRVALINGYSGFEPQGSKYLARLVDFSTDGTRKEVIEALRILGVQTFILDRGHMTDEEIDRWGHALGRVDASPRYASTDRFVVQHIGGTTPRFRAGWQQIDARMVVESAIASERILVPFVLVNTGSVAWRPIGRPVVQRAEISWRLQGSGEDAVRADISILPPPVIPAGSVSQVLHPVSVRVPEAPGMYDVVVRVDGFELIRTSIRVRASGSKLLSPDLQAEVRLYTSNACVRSGERVVIQAEVINTGAIAWDAQHRLGFRWLVPDGRFVMDDLDALEGRLTVSYDEQDSPWIQIPPGSGYLFEGPIPTPIDPGTYKVRVGMVKEQVRWFGNQTVSVLVRPSGDPCQ